MYFTIELYLKVTKRHFKLYTNFDAKYRTSEVKEAPDGSVHFKKNTGRTLGIINLFFHTTRLTFE